MDRKEIIPAAEYACLAFLPDAVWIHQNLAIGITNTFPTHRIVYSAALLSSSASENEACNKALLENARVLLGTGKRLLFFSYAFDSIVSSEVLKELGSMGFLRVTYCVDAYHQWFRHCKLGPYYDAAAVSQKINFEKFQKFFPKVLFMPMAANPVK